MSARRLSLCYFLALLSSPAALAQEFTPPRFEALEQQQQILEQRQLDALERQRMTEQTRAFDPANGVSPAESATRDMEHRSEIQRFQLEIERERQRTERETAMDKAKLPNRRIAPFSSLVVDRPEQFALPPAPEGQYYAHLNGRFVLVDRTSELVVRVLDPIPFTPNDDDPESNHQPVRQPVSRP